MAWGMNDKSVEASRVPGKMLGVELARFICALAVLVWHYHHFYQASGSPAYVRTAQPFYPLLSLFYEHGKYGVLLFWAISGFIFFWKYGAAVASGAISGSRFFWLRFSRLYPLHFATLLLVAALQPLHQVLTGHSFIYEGNNLPNFFLQLAMATHWSPPQPQSFNGPIWSVSAELFVYALFFLLVRRFGNSAWMIGAAILGSIVALFAGVETPAIVCVGYFFIGGLVAKLLAQTKMRHEIHGPRLVAGAMIVALFGGAWWAGLLGNTGALEFVLRLSVGPFIFLAAQDWRMLDRFEAPIQRAGNVTYSTYLCHFPLQLTLAIAAAASGWALPVSSPLFLASYLGATLLIALLVYERFERPTQAWIRSMTVSRDPAITRKSRRAVRSAA
jgi:peptidoglycan/LPS O-acetylase OafA/YrhL